MIIFSLNTFYRFSQKTNILFIQNRRYSGNTFPPPADPLCAVSKISASGKFTARPLISLHIF